MNSVLEDEIKDLLNYNPNLEYGGCGVRRFWKKGYMMARVS